MTTLDLELEIGRNRGDGYPVLARTGGEMATTRLPVTSVELDRQFAALRSAVLASSLPADPVVHDPAQTDDQRHMRKLGTRLFDALLTGDVRQLYAATRRRAAEPGTTMRLVLRGHPAELTRLPWEFLFDPDRRDYLGLGLSLVRYPEVLAPRQPLRTEAPLRILGMVGHCGDQPAAAADEQRRRLQEALAGLEHAGLVQWGWVDGHTPADLAQALSNGRWHGLHFFGSGQPDWSDEVSGLLADHHTLRLVVLNCCAAGSGAAAGGFAGPAGALIRQGIPAVVAMHFEITAAALRELAHPLYHSVAQGLPVDIGVMRARRAVRLAKKDTLEWGTPVLYLRAPDGRIFDAAVPVPEPESSESSESSGSLPEQPGPADPEALYAEAMDAFWAGQWQQAGALLGTVLAQHPEYLDAAVRLEQADREQQLHTRYQQAVAAAEAQEWEQAIDGFAAVAVADPLDLEVRDRLAEARDRRAAAQRLAKAERDRAASARSAPEPPRLVRHPTAELVLHSGKEVNAIAFSPDGDRLATAGRKNIAQIWDTGSGAELLSVGAKAWRRTMEGVVFSADGSRLATASDDGTARIWDVTSGEELLAVAHDIQVWGVAFSPDGRRLATAADDCTARIWDAGSGEELFKLPHENWVRAVAFSPDGRWLATAGVDRTARIWDTTDGEESVTVQHASLVTGVAFSPDGRRLATASDDGTAGIWDATMGRGLAGFVHDSPVTEVAFSPDGAWLATASQDCTVRVWDVGAGRELATVRHADQVWAVAFSPDGARLATGSADRTARLWALTVQ